MNLWKIRLLVVSMLFVGMVFVNQGVLKADKKDSPYYEGGKVSVDLGGGERGTVNWETRFITAKGMVPITIPITKNEALARRGAVLDAQRRLLEIVKGVQIDSKTVVSDLMEVSDVVKSKVSGVVSNAEIIDEKKDNGNYVVTMQAPMGDFISVIIEETKIPRPDFLESSEYTGLVIDARGLNLEPAIFINIYNDKDGVKVCGPIHPVYRVSVKNLNDINEYRIGANPLRIKAKGTTGPSGVDITISNGNAKKVRKKILNTGIFSKSRVVVLID
ncbi:MAG: hypothetical protein SCARUB_00778 [Candidatus Scalindua rubra]|uniref:Uncharacterized protein n=1 Tax=Candidatus Scalindua rubra TaxID=1872076 RepID=A0A1E3XEP8_9BACT|nr:MAG: hypothetical protein SCARUB_00778 [Candidatus Scalindua rubra]